jgi:crotonobetainyl-CoA:carnitine CoA-transferase CaiB-like acyl-CoA transferase
MEILAGCDAVMSNLRGDVRRKLGLTYDVLAPQLPHIGCA